MLVDAAMTAAVVLAVTFAWAGAAKLGRPAATAEGFADLGLRRPRVLARAVPVVELILAVALLSVPGLGGIVALGLLAGFTFVLARALRQGVPVRCACFGRAGAAPLSAVDLVRNGLLGSLAGLAAAAGLEPHRPSLGAAAVVLVAVILGAVLLFVLRRRASRGG